MEKTTIRETIRENHYFATEAEDFESALAEDVKAGKIHRLLTPIIWQAQASGKWGA